MKNFNSPNYDNESRDSALNRSISQNHYYIQANQFQRRYRNSFISAYRSNRAKFFSPSCSTEKSKQNERKMIFNKNEKSNQGQYDHNFGQYYQTSHFIQNSDQQAVNHLQKSKHFLEGLIQKSNFHLKIHKEKTQNEIKTLQKLIQTKDKEIQQLNKQITRLKKIFLETFSNGASISYIKQDRSYLVEIQNKEKTIKQLEREINQFRQENSYFRQDIEIKNKEIQMQKSKFKMLQDRDANLKKQIEKQNIQLKQEIKSLSEKINWFERYKEQKQVQWITEKQRVKKIETELQMTKIKAFQAKSESEKMISRNMEKFKTFQNQFIVLRQRSNEKDLQIQGLLSKITCIQSDLNFFKDKFTNLVFEIERQERQSTAIYDHAVSLREQGLRFYDATLKIKESNQVNWFDNVQNRLTQSIPLMKTTLGKDITIYSPSQKNITSYNDYGNFFQSRHEITNKLSAYP